MDVQQLKHIGLYFLLICGCPWVASLHKVTQVLWLLLCNNSTISLSPTTICIWLKGVE